MPYQEVQSGSFTFVGKWLETVRHLLETGMGHTIVSITLADGKHLDQVVINSRSLTIVPFVESDIVEIKATHDKRKFR